MISIQLYGFSSVTTKVIAAGTSMQTCLMPVQVDVMELQSGLLGWQVEKLTKCTNPAAHSVTVRMGFFFRLTLEVQEGGAVSGALELTQPGSHLSLLLVKSEILPLPVLYVARQASLYLQLPGLRSIPAFEKSEM